MGMAAGPVSRLGSFEPGHKTGLRLSPNLVPSTIVLTTAKTDTAPWVASSPLTLVNAAGTRGQEPRRRDPRPSGVFVVARTHKRTGSSSFKLLRLLGWTCSLDAERACTRHSSVRTPDLSGTRRNVDTIMPQVTAALTRSQYLECWGHRSASKTGPGDREVIDDLTCPHPGDRRVSAHIVPRTLVPQACAQPARAAVDDPYLSSRQMEKIEALQEALEMERRAREHLEAQLAHALATKA